MVKPQGFSAGLLVSSGCKGTKAAEWINGQWVSNSVGSGSLQPVGLDFSHCPLLVQEGVRGAFQRREIASKRLNVA